MSFVNRDQIEERLEELRRRFNQAQLDAAESIIAEPLQEDGFLLPIVDGPPGTGKTTLGVYAALRAMLDEGLRGVLYVAPTNFAAQQAKYTFERLGVRSRDVIWLNPRGRQRDWNRGIIGTRWDLSDLGPNDIRLLRNAPIITCTPYMLGRVRKGQLRPSNTKVIIDEFSQVDPALFFMILSRTGADRERYLRGGYALLGDPLQLPIVTTQEELLENIFEFILSQRTIDGGICTLSIQHRMHHEICNAVDRMRRQLSFWHGYRPLEPSDYVRDRDLIRLGYDYEERNVINGRVLDNESLREILDPSHTFVIVNTDRLQEATCEERTPSGSLRNIREADAAVDIAIATYRTYRSRERNLIPCIISPYSAQVSEIKNRLNARAPNISINVDDCVMSAYRSQGREFPLVIVSLVRRNQARVIGFLEDEKLRAQIYVACSRAQGKLIVIMSKDTFGGKPLYDELVNVGGSRHTFLWGWD